VNRGLERLLEYPDLQLFWVLNPDCRFPPDTGRLIAEAGKREPFALMGGRTVYDDDPLLVQSDGGQVSAVTGTCRSINSGVRKAEADLPAASDLDFIAGASCVASREFLETAGLMREDYFLYYEEVDWAFRRGNLPLLFVPEIVVRHIGGTAIGSASLGRQASAFSNYFNYRSRMLFLRRFMPLRLPIGLLHALAKSAQMVLRGQRREASAVLAGSFDRQPPREVRQRLDAESLALLKPRSDDDQS
ncbi:MAG: glycosyltransferase family 2 protein, partial [Erythrobacter sp.]